MVLWKGMQVCTFTSLLSKRELCDTQENDAGNSRKKPLGRCVLEEVAVVIDTKGQILDSSMRQIWSVSGEEQQGEPRVFAVAARSYPAMTWLKHLWGHREMVR